MTDTIGELLIKWANERDISDQNPSRNGLCANITEELGEWLKGHDENDVHEQVDALADMSTFCMAEMIKMGYHPDKVMQEAHKELSSRTGEWNDDIQKWKKYTTPEAKAKWIKADFTDCKL